MNTDTTRRSRLVVGIVIASLLACVAISGPIAAQNATDNGTPMSNETTMDNGTTMGNETGMDGGTSMNNGTNESDGINASLTADPTAAAGLSNHTLTVTVGDSVAGNLSEVRLNYSGTNVSTDPITGNASLVTLGEQTVPNPNNVTIASVESTQLRFSFDLNESLRSGAGDQLTMTYPVFHPDETGNHTISGLINPDNESLSLTGNFTITPNETTPVPQDSETTTDLMGGDTTMEANGSAAGTGTSAAETTEAASTEETTTEEPTTEAATTEEPAEGTTAAETTSSGNGPGFGALVAVVSVLALGLFALRRN